MKLVSWNVNGLRACIQKGFLEQFDKLDADFFCLQETKLSQGQLNLTLPGYEQYWCYADKKGYSGTAIFTKHTPLSVRYGLDVPELDGEGRLITLEYQEFYLVNCYTPNAQRGLARLGHRLKWDDAFRAYLQKLDAEKPVILCGDLNVAHQEIDLKNPKSNRGNAGFSDAERESFQKTLDAGFTDTFRHLHPDAAGCYSWWSYMFHARETNAGWRIDYFLVSDRVKDAIYRAEIHSDVLGSDHCPVSLHIDLTCNGGIWSPMSLGKAKVQTAEKSEPMVSAVKVKALAAIAALCVIVLDIGLLWPSASNPNIPDPTDGPSPLMYDPINVYVYETPLTGISSTAFDVYVDGSSVPHTGEVYNLFHDGQMYYSTNQYLTDNAYLDANVWLRVELNAEGRAAYQNGWIPELIATDDATILHDMTVLEYVDVFSSHTQTTGWLIFAQLDTAAALELKLYCGTQVYTETVNLSPYQLLYDYWEYLSVTQLDQPWFSEIYMMGQSSLGPMPIYIQSGDRNWYIRNQEWYYLPHNADYWFYVEPTWNLKTLFNLSELTLVASNPDAVYDPSLSSLPPYVTAIELYASAFDTQPAGWLVYGNDVNASSLKITLARRNDYGYTGLGYSQTVDVTVRDKKETVTAKELVDSILQDEDFCWELLQVPPDTYKSEHYPRVASGNATFQELLTHSDAVDALMSCNPPKEFKEVPSILLYVDATRQIMDPWQEAIYLMDMYYSSPSGFNYSYGTKGESYEDYSTSQLVYTICGDWSLLDYMYSGSSLETDLLIYYIAREYNAVLRQLETREDALSFMESRENATTTSPVLHSLFELWPYISTIDEMPFDE